MLLTSRLSSNPVPRELHTLDHFILFPHLVANKLAIVMIAKGTPTHFFSILSDTLASCSSGHLPVFIAKYILRYSNFLFGDVEAKRFQLISTTNLFGDIETMGSCDNSVSTIIIRECTSYHVPN